MMERGGMEEQGEEGRERRRRGDLLKAPFCDAFTSGERAA